MSIDGSIIHLSTATSWRGGELQVLNLAIGLRAAGYTNIIITQPGSPLAERATASDIRVVEIKCRSEFDVSAMWKISRVLKRENAALIHAHDAHAVTLTAFAGRLGGGVPRLATRRVDFKLNSVWKYRWGLQHLICISAAIQDVCQAAGVPAEKMSVVHSGIDLARVQNVKVNVPALRGELGEEKKKRLIILNVASLTDHKGQEYLLDAMTTVVTQVPQALLVIVGEGELENTLKRKALNFALEEHTIFLGFREDVPALLQACDLFVMASHLEGLCTSVMDAMAAGRAVVATQAGGLPELVIPDKTGLLVAPRDPNALAEALIELLKDRKQRARFGTAAAQEATRRFGAQPMIDGTIAVYNKMLG